MLSLPLAAPLRSVALAALGLLAQTLAQPGQETPYLTPEYLERTGPPYSPFSLQSFYAILRRCERVAPEPSGVAARAAAFERLLDRATTSSGLWRTFTDSQGRLRETRFPSARAMFVSPEFAADLRRYEATVAAVRLSVLQEDCREYESLVAQALAGK